MGFKLSCETHNFSGSFWSYFDGDLLDKTKGINFLFLTWFSGTGSCLVLFHVSLFVQSLVTDSLKLCKR